MIRTFLCSLAAVFLSSCYLVPYEMSSQQAAGLSDRQLVAACSPKDEWGRKKPRDKRSPAIAEAVKRGLIRKSMVADILNGYAVVGMTENEALASWGKPRDVNRTMSANYDQEQWCYGEYGGNYLYFSGGRLRTIQN